MGSPDADYYLGELIFNGIGTPKNINQAIVHTQKAYDGGFKMAAWRLGFCYSRGLGVAADKNTSDKYYLECIEPMRILAEANDPEAQGNLGSMFNSGTGVSENEELAFEWYKKAADQGYAFVQHSVAQCYEYGTGVKQDKDEALKYYRLAAETGNPSSQMALGKIYLNGTMVEEDDNEGVRWIKMAAEQNYSEALNLLAVMHFNGTVVQQDKSMAFKYIDKAVQYDSSNVSAINNLAYLYKTGEGVNANYQSAINFYLLAVKNDPTQAESNYYSIAMLYYEGGEGISRDAEKCIDFMQKAANNGNDAAIDFLKLVR